MDRLKRIAGFVLAGLLLPVLLLLFVLWFPWFFAWGIILRIWFWRSHAVEGRRVLFVYSESPNWQEYIEERILPCIQERAVVLNWSQRRLWSAESGWEARFFRHFSGRKEINPLALVFCRRGRVRSVRFYQAFLDFKHGNKLPLQTAEAELFELMEAAG